MKTSTNRWGQR